MRAAIILSALIFAGCQTTPPLPPKCQPEAKAYVKALSDVDLKAKSVKACDK